MSKLRELGRLRSGYQLRGALEELSEGPHRIVTLSNVKEEGIEWDKVSRVQLRTENEDFLRDGDILFRSRGSHYGVALVSNPPQKTVASAPLFLISIEKSDVIPGYIEWFFNRIEILLLLEKLARGGMLPTINIQDLGDMEIPIPSIEIQKSIIEVAGLVQKERTLTTELIKKRAVLANHILGRMANRKLESSRT